MNALDRLLDTRYFKILFSTKHQYVLFCLFGTIKYSFYITHFYILMPLCIGTSTKISFAFAVAFKVVKKNLPSFRVIRFLSITTNCENKKSQKCKYKSCHCCLFCGGLSCSIALISTIYAFEHNRNCTPRYINKSFSLKTLCMFKELRKQSLKSLNIF